MHWSLPSHAACTILTSAKAWQELRFPCGWLIVPSARFPPAAAGVLNPKCVSKRNRQVWTGFSKTKHWREMVTEKCRSSPCPPWSVRVFLHTRAIQRLPTGHWRPLRRQRKASTYTQGSCKYTRSQHIKCSLYSQGKIFLKRKKIYVLKEVKFKSYAIQQ